MALYRTGQADPERLYRKLRRQAARRVAERDLVHDLCSEDRSGLNGAWTTTPSRHSFGDHYEEARGYHHEYLKDVHTGKVVEFRAPEVADLIREIAARLHYRPTAYFPAARCIG